LSETELIQQILAGDEGAKTRFYQAHSGRLKPICVHFLGYQDSDIDDTIQQTFLIAFQKLGEFEPRSTLYTWLAHICVNLCYERIRKRKRVLVSLQADLEQMTASLAKAQNDEKDRMDEDHKKIKLMEGLIKTMGEKCRKVVELRDLEGQSYAAIGKLLKIPIGTVMSQLARCRETLKQLVQGSLKEGL
jgi:RNA polymerase sigma-70 factor (ECF subfamily)